MGGPANAGPDAILQPPGQILLNPLARTRENDSLLQRSAGRQKLDPNISLGPCDIALPAAAEAEGRLPAAVRAPVYGAFASPSSRHHASLPHGPTDKSSKRSHIVTLTAGIASPTSCRVPWRSRSSSALGPTCPRVASPAQTPARVAHGRHRPGVRPCVAARARRQRGTSGQRPGRRWGVLVRTSDDARWPIADHKNDGALAIKIHVGPWFKTGVASQDDAPDDALRDARRGPNIGSWGSPRVSGLGPAPGTPSRSSMPTKRGPASPVRPLAYCVCSAIQSSSAARGTRTDRPIRMTGSSLTASIANTFDRPNPSSLATSPAFSSSGSMAGPTLSALDFSVEPVVPSCGAKTPSTFEIGPRSAPASEGVASQDDHPSGRP